MDAPNLIEPLSGSLETDLSEAEFDRIAAIMFAQSRVALRPGKEGLIRSRLARHVRRLGLRSYTEYLDYIEDDATGRELSQMVDSLTTNKTNFYREGEHFELLRDRVIPPLLATGDPVRIWSAGCSSGEEPYTLAMVLHSTASRPVLDNVRILATDISARVLRLAVAGEYPVSAADDLPRSLASAYLRPDSRNDPTTVRVRDDVRSMVHFARLNLMDSWPMKQSFQVIFCRNVMIYFDRETQQELVQRFWEALAPGGHLFIGHSESLTPKTHRFRYVQPAVYVK